MMTPRTLPHPLLLAALVLAATPAAADEAPATPEARLAPEVRAAREGEAAALAEAQAGIEAAVEAMREARQQMGRTRTETEAERERLRDELSRTHRALREASREVARAHRELAMAERERIEHVRMINLGDRAVIGVLLGPETEDGIRLVGVSPGGPAEEAGLRQDDVLVTIGDVELSGLGEGEKHDAIYEVMDSVGDGQEIAVAVLRDGERRDFTVTAERREPAAWQSLLRLPAPLPPAAPAAPDAPHGSPDPAPAPDPAPHIVIDRIEIPEIDHEALQRQLEDIREQVQRFEYRFIGEDGEIVDFAQEFDIDGDAFSGFGGHGLNQAGAWLGLPFTRGLELVSLNPELGRYFDAERGVLVVRAAADNAYGLESGDVIERIAGDDVASPADVLRALRDAEPGTEVEFGIKRDKRQRTLKADMPERRLGFQRFHRDVPPGEDESKAGER